MRIFNISFAVLWVILLKSGSLISSFHLRCQPAREANNSANKAGNKTPRHAASEIAHHRDNSYKTQKTMKSNLSILIAEPKFIQVVDLESWVARRRTVLKSLPGLRTEVIAQIDRSDRTNVSFINTECDQDCFVCRGTASDGLINDTQQWMLILCRSCARDCGSCALAVPLPLRRRCRSCAKWAVYGSPNSNATGKMRAVSCAEHKGPKEIDVVHRLCMAGCGTIATSGCREQGLGRPLYCKRHRPPGCRTITNRQCQHPEGCLTWPAFGPAPAAPSTAARAPSLARFCRRHRSPDHVDLVNRRCAARGCMKQPRFGAAGPGSPARFCKAHWKEAAAQRPAAPEACPSGAAQRPADDRPAGRPMANGPAGERAADGRDARWGHARGPVRACRVVAPLAGGTRRRSRDSVAGRAGAVDMGGDVAAARVRPV